jgi:hypothetical protein
MLRWSGHEQQVEVDLTTVAAGCGDAGLPHADELLRFATAAADLRDDGDAMAAARATLVERAGADVMLDAAATAANFQMMTRLADGTGARYPAARLADMAGAVDAMGTATFVSRR